MRVLVCDDEPLAVRHLISKLRSFSDVEVVAATTDAMEAAQFIRLHDVDVAFLDVDMPERDGIEIAASITRGGRRRDMPLAVMITAHRQYAAEAFDIGVTDFVLKPVSELRLGQALDRLRTAMRDRENNKRLRAVETLVWRGAASQPKSASSSNPAHHSTVRVSDDFRNVEHVVAHGHHTHIHSGGGYRLCRETIGRLAESLEPMGFARVHRSHIVKLSSVMLVRRTPNGSSSLRLRGGDVVPLGRQYASRIRRLLQAGRGDALTA